nr:MAG TPA: Pectate lyase [Crassvirales sp.]
MFFTQEDYRKIEKWLLSNSRKDTDFVGAATPLKGNETLAFVQDGKNVNVRLKDLIEQIFLLGVSDFLNVSDKYGESIISLTQAIQLIPFRSRKIGQVITFLNEEGHWKLYQFQGKSLNQWNNSTLWIDLLAKISGIPIIDSEDIITKVDDAKQVSLYLADKQYNEADYSGLGRVYLRKNIQTLTDPNTGETRLINYLTQTMVGKENVIYHIQYDYNLNGQTIIIPEGCVLKFEGGSLKNGNIQFNKTTFINPKFSDVRFTGSVLNQQLNIDDFGAIKGDENFDNSVIINDLINLKKRDAYAGAKTIFVPSGAYYIKNSIQLYDYYNSNITLTGEGLSSVIAQVTDNIPIIKSYETTIISNLRLIYKNWQPVTNTNATAIAVQRAIRSVFENLMIVDAQKAFGYITIADQEADKITDFKDQCYVNANTRNVGIYQCSSYAIDLRKEIAQADSGSVYDNIYISSSHPINGYDETKPSVGAIYMGGSSMTFTQLNIESKYSDTLIMSTSLTNYLTIANLHIEGLTTMRTIYKQVAGQGFFDIGNIDIDRCAFTTNNLFLFYFSVSIKFNIDLITLRSSCTIPEGNQWFIFQQDSGTSYGRLGNHSYPAGMAPTRVNNSYDHIVLRIDRSDFLVTYGSQDQFTTPSINNWLLYAGGNTLAYLYNKAIYVDNNGDYRYPDGYLARLNGVTIRRSGTTAQRPTLDTTFIGFTYYDTTINELLTWSGTGWINPDGTSISRVNFIKTVTDITNLESGNRLLRIVGNINLNGETLTIPEGCTLDFQGGSFSNGTIVGGNTKIITGLQKIFNSNIILTGTWNVEESYPEWFGAVGDGVTNDTVALTKCINYFTVTSLSARTYITDQIDNIPSFRTIRGCGKKSIIQANPSMELTNSYLLRTKDGGSGIIFSDFVLLGGSNSTESNYKIGGIALRSTSNDANDQWDTRNIIQNVEIKNCYAASIYIGTYQRENKIVNCFISHTTNVGINCNGTDNMIIGCTVASSHQEGIIINGNNRIDSCKCFGCGASTTETGKYALKLIGNKCNVSNVELQQNNYGGCIIQGNSNYVQVTCDNNGSGTTTTVIGCSVVGSYNTVIVTSCNFSFHDDNYERYFVSTNWNTVGNNIIINGTPLANNKMATLSPWSIDNICNNILWNGFNITQARETPFNKYLVPNKYTTNGTGTFIQNNCGLAFRISSVTAINADVLSYSFSIPNSIMIDNNGCFSVKARFHKDSDVNSIIYPVIRVITTYTNSSGSSVTRTDQNTVINLLDNKDSLDVYALTSYHYLDDKPVSINSIIIEFVVMSKAIASGLAINAYFDDIRIGATTAGDKIAFLNEKGTTSARPTLALVSAGFKYYDTTLNKYIMSNGTAWTNLDGTALT